MIKVYMMKLNTTISKPSKFIKSKISIIQIKEILKINNLLKQLNLIIIQVMYIILKENIIKHCSIMKLQKIFQSRNWDANLYQG